jgi:acetyl-CoA carboxylase carboxyltransferase component
VFSRRLNEKLETLAVDGARASVIGGSAAAAVVFAREVDADTRADERVRELDARLEAADGAERAALRAERERVWAAVRAEKMGALADRFDHAHSVERAVRVGSVDRIVEAATLRPALIEAIERGMRRAAEEAADADRLAHPVVG